MHLLKRLAAKEGTVLVFILLKKRIAALEKLLDKFASNDWRSGCNIFLIEIEDQYANSSRHARAAVRKQNSSFGLSADNDNVRYIIINDFGFNMRHEIKWVRHAEFVTESTYKRLADDFLELRLKEWKLDWRSAVLSEISKWTHDQISPQDLELWLTQFDKISDGEFRWVGERLLRNFKVISSHDFANSLEKNYKKIEGNKQLCIIRYENGKSADSISVVIRKQLSHIVRDAEIFEYRDFLAGKSDASAYVAEDGAFTGIEISDLFCSLMGIDGFKKCIPLSENKRLSNLTTYLFFSLATDVGIFKIEKTIKDLGIKVSIHCDEEIKVLSASGHENLLSEKLYELDEHGKEVLRSPDTDIVPQAFIDKRWGERREKAVAFCREKGKQIFGSYQKRKGKHWTERRLSDCALGAGNMALLIAFSHSVPKSTIPFFWCHGESVDSKGRSFEWLPLFPSAHRL